MELDYQGDRPQCNINTNFLMHTATSTENPEPKKELVELGDKNCAGRLFHGNWSPPPHQNKTTQKVNPFQHVNRKSMQKDCCNKVPTPALFCSQRQPYKHF